MEYGNMTSPEDEVIGADGDPAVAKSMQAEPHAV
jgi:hypothetical protein